MTESCIIMIKEINKYGGNVEPYQVNHVLNIKSIKPHIKTWLTALYLGKLVKKGYLDYHCKNGDSYYKVNEKQNK